MWVVDTCVVLDVLEDDPQFGLSSARVLERLLSDGLCVSPVTMVELSAAFSGDLMEQKQFLNSAGISYSEPWTTLDTESSHIAWNNYVQARRARKTMKRPVANLLIGGFASNRTGLVTRKPSDFNRWFPRLPIREP